MLNKIISYLEGNYRYKIYYSKYFGWLMRDHIRDQINIRIHSMKYECYRSGQCTECGCRTTALQMANIPCKGECYPPMMSKVEWNIFIADVRLNEEHGQGPVFKAIGDTFWTIDWTCMRFKKLKALCGEIKK